MYELKKSDCCTHSPYTLTEEEYNWMVEQLKAKRTLNLKEAIEQYLNYYGLAELQAVFKCVLKESEKN